MSAEALREKIGDREVIASVSGGKDSTAMCLYLRELGIPYTAVHTITGWDHPDVMAYLEEVLPQHIGPIQMLRADVSVPEALMPHVLRLEAMLGHESPMVRLVIKKGMFPSRVRRFCTEAIKVKPIARFINGLDADAVNTVGVRASESAARARLPEWEEWRAIDCEVWRPIIRWTDQEVVDIHTRHAAPPNPLYLRGASRVGCWPCIFARKAEIRMMADTDPEHVDFLRELERVVASLARDRHEARGEEMDNDPSWFQAPLRNREGARSCWPIQRVVEWSRTRRGGRQMEIFAPPAREWGCMRWGVCDTGAGES